MPKPSKQNQFQDYFEGRLYSTDSGEAVPVNCELQGSNLLTKFVDGRYEPFSADMEDFDVDVGGSNDDKLILIHPQSGARIVLNDLALVEQLGPRAKDIKQKLKKAKRNNATGMAFSLGIFGWIFPLFIIVVMGGCSILASLHHSRSEQTQPAETSAAPPAQKVSSPKTLLETYAKYVAETLTASWAPPRQKKDLKAQAQVRLSEGGLMDHPKMLTPSGAKAFDSSILKVLKAKSKLEYSVEKGVIFDLTLDFSVHAGKPAITPGDINIVKYEPASQKPAGAAAEPAAEENAQETQ